jgi:hypothetical protein
MLLFGRLARQTAQCRRKCQQAGEWNFMVTNFTQAISAIGNSMQRHFDGLQFGHIVFLHGECGVSLGDVLSMRLLCRRKL